jgi:hypothetical protein
MCAVYSRLFSSFGFACFLAAALVGYPDVSEACYSGTGCARDCSNGCGVLGVPGKCSGFGACTGRCCDCSCHDVSFMGVWSCEC